MSSRDSAISLIENTLRHNVRICGGTITMIINLVVMLLFSHKAALKYKILLLWRAEVKIVFMPCKWTSITNINYFIVQIAIKLRHLCVFMCRIPRHVYMHILLFCCWVLCMWKMRSPFKFIYLICRYILWSWSLNVIRGLAEI